MSVFYKYFCKGCSTWFNKWSGLAMYPTRYPICPTCGTDYYVTETTE